METDALRNEFYKSRSLAGRVAAAFRFINAHFRYLFKRSSYILLPLALVQALYFALFAASPASSVASLVASVLLTVITIAGSLLFYSFLYTSLQIYAETGYLPMLTLKELWPTVLRNAKKLFYVGFFIFLFYGCLLLISWLGVLASIYTLIVILPLAVFLMVPLTFFGFRYVLEPEEMGVAFRKSYRMGITYWGSTFAMILIAVVLVGIIQLVASLPLATSLYVERVAVLSRMEGNEAVLPGFFRFLLFFLAFVSTFVSLVSVILSVALMAFQYGSAVATRNERRAELSGNEYPER